MIKLETLPANRISLRYAYDLMRRNERVIDKTVRVDMLRDENVEQAKAYVFDYTSRAIADNFLKKGLMKFRERKLTKEEKLSFYGDELLAFESRVVIMSSEDAETIREILVEAMRVLGEEFKTTPRSISER